MHASCASLRAVAAGGPVARAVAALRRARALVFPLRLAFVLVAGSLPGAALAAEAAAVHRDGADPEAAWEAAPVVVDGQTLFEVHRLLARPAQQRAAAIAARIEQAAEDPSFDPRTLRVEEIELGSAILAGDRRLLVVTDEDARLEMAARPTVARAYRDVIADAMLRYREARSHESIVAGVLTAALAALALLAALVVIFRAVRAADGLLARRLEGRVQDVGIQSLRIVSANAIWTALRFLVRGIAIAAALTAVYFALWFSLDAFADTRVAAARIADLALQPLARFGSAVLAGIPSVLFLLFVALGTRWLLRLLRLLFTQVEHGSVRFHGFEPEWSLPTYRIVRVLVVAFALVVAYPYIPGSDSAAFKGISVFLGVMFSLGSTSFIANTIAGYAMTYRRAFRVGDLIRAGDAFGTVTDMRLQVTHLRSAKNEEVVVPNSQLLQQTVVNYSSLARTDGLILHTEVGIGYETPWRQVEAMLLLAADRAEGFLKEPKPFVRQRALGDFAVTYELNVYTRRVGEMLALYTELHRHILDVFNEYGVQIMTPNYEGDPETPKVVAKEQWFLAPGAEVPPAVPHDAPATPVPPRPGPGLGRATAATAEARPAGPA
jgi:small-conductance mechanosensitive channel